MINTFRAKWEPTQEQIDNQILPAYTKLAKQSVLLINEFQCPPEYVADMLRAVSYTHLTLPTSCCV